MSVRLMKLLALCLGTLVACSDGAEDQILTGRVDTSQGALAIRAVADGEVITATPVRTDGSFTLTLPAGSTYRLEVLTRTRHQEPGAALRQRAARPVVQGLPAGRSVRCRRRRRAEHQRAVHGGRSELHAVRSHDRDGLRAAAASTHVRSDARSELQVRDRGAGRHLLPGRRSELWSAALHGPRRSDLLCGRVLPAALLAGRSELLRPRCERRLRAAQAVRCHRPGWQLRAADARAIR
jgi:hypothetical protein